MGCNNSKNLNRQFSTISTDIFICCVNYFDVHVWRLSTFGKKSLGASFCTRCMNMHDESVHRHRELPRHRLRGNTNLESYKETMESCET
jgi:hypothetical protein